METLEPTSEVNGATMTQILSCPHELVVGGQDGSRFLRAERHNAWSSPSNIFRPKIWLLWAGSHGHWHIKLATVLQYKQWHQLHSLLNHQHRLDSLPHLSVWDAPVVAWRWPSGLVALDVEKSASPGFCPSRSLPSHYPVLSRQQSCPFPPKKLTVLTAWTNGQMGKCLPQLSKQYDGLPLGTIHPSTRSDQTTLAVLHRRWHLVNAHHHAFITQWCWMFKHLR